MGRPMGDAVSVSVSEAERKTAINKRFQLRYEELMEDGEQGHYETMFRALHEELTRCANESYTRGMIDQHDEPLSTEAINRLRSRA